MSACRRCGEPVQHAAGGERLQRALLRELSGHRCSPFEVGADQRVTELAGGPGGPSIHPPAEHQASAHARPHREHHEVPDGHVGAVVGLRQCRARGVVVDEHRKAEAFFENQPQGNVRELHVHAPLHSAGRELHHRRDPDADGRRVRTPHGLDRGDDLVDQRVGVRGRGGQHRANLQLTAPGGSRPTPWSRRRRHRSAACSSQLDQRPRRITRRTSPASSSRTRSAELPGRSPAASPERSRRRLGSPPRSPRPAKPPSSTAQLRTAASSVSAVPASRPVRGAHDAGRRRSRSPPRPCRRRPEARLRPASRR